MNGQVIAAEHMPPAAASVAVSVSPKDATLGPGQQQSFSALESALAQTPAGQKANVFTISAGAQSFTSAYGLLTPGEQSRIGNVTYMIAGSKALTLPSGTGTTNFIMDWLEPQIPAGRPKGSYNQYFAYKFFTWCSGSHRRLPKSAELDARQPMLESTGADSCAESSTSA